MSRQKLEDRMDFCENEEPRDISDNEIDAAYAHYENSDKASALISYAFATEDGLLILEEILDFCDKLKDVDMLMLEKASLNLRLIRERAERSAKLEVYALIERGVL